jgi:hypothetical protein
MRTFRRTSENRRVICVERPLVDPLAKQEALSRVDRLAPRPVVATDDRSHSLPHRLVNLRLSLLALFENQTLQGRHIIRQFIDRTTAVEITSDQLLRLLSGLNVVGRTGGVAT